MPARAARACSSAKVDKVDSNLVRQLFANHTAQVSFQMAGLNHPAKRVIGKSLVPTATRKGFEMLDDRRV
jgi:hypothetical protein